MRAAIKDLRTNVVAQRYLLIHYSTIITIYVFATIISLQLLTIPAAHRDFITTLSSSAILATFGSAIATVGMLWTSDRASRILTNVDIFYSGIIKKPAWKRWPFLTRSRTRLWVDGETLVYTLANPEVVIEFDAKKFGVLLPTVEQDYFDLPVLSNLVPLLRNREKVHGVIANPSSNNIFPTLELAATEQYMAYECLTDVWYSVFILRVSRYVIHFGVALTISSAMIGGVAAWWIS